MSLIHALVFTAVFLLPFSKSAAEGGFIAALVLWLVKKIVSREKWTAPALLTAVYLGLLAVLLLSVTQAAPEYTLVSLRGFLKWLKFIGIFFMTMEIFKDGGASKKLILVFLISTALLTLNGFFQMITGQDLVTHHSIDIPGRLIRMRSSLGSPNGLAAFYLFSIPLSFLGWLSEKHWSKKAYFFLAVCALSCIGLGLTLSRAAVFALLLAAMLFFLFQKKFRFVLLGAVLSALFLMSSPTMRENFLNSLNFQDETIGERLSFWKTSWHMIQARPLLGHGVNTYYQIFPKFAPIGESYRGYAHNCYLQMGCEAGILGLVLFLIPFAVILIKYLFFKTPGDRNFSLRDSLFIACAAFLMQAFFDTHFYSLQLSYLFWIFWALFTAECTQKKFRPS